MGVSIHYSGTMDNLNEVESMNKVGGLVQATSDELSENVKRALAITQLKRALSTHPYTRGAIVGLRHEGTNSPQRAEPFQEDLAAILTSIHDLLEQARARRAGKSFSSISGRSSSLGWAR